MTKVKNITYGPKVRFVQNVWAWDFFPAALAIFLSLLFPPTSEPSEVYQWRYTMVIISLAACVANLIPLLLGLFRIPIKIPLINASIPRMFFNFATYFLYLLRMHMISAVFAWAAIASFIHLFLLDSLEEGNASDNTVQGLIAFILLYLITIVIFMVASNPVLGSRGWESISISDD